MSTSSRPTGVTLLALLQIISGIIGVGLGLFVMTLLGSAGLDEFRDIDGSLTGVFGVTLTETIVVAISSVSIVLGILSFVMAWGLFKGKSWAWTITLILTIVSLIFDIPSMNIIGIIINIVILYYLSRPYVKAYFGKGPQVA